MTSKYDAITGYLNTLDADSVTLTFTDMEAIVGPLPVSALQATSWWRGTPYRHPHIFHWDRAGWVADRPDFLAGTVTFRRLGVS